MSNFQSDPQFQPQFPPGGPPPMQPAIPPKKHHRWAPFVAYPVVFLVGAGIGGAAGGATTTATSSPGVTTTVTQSAPAPVSETSSEPPSEPAYSVPKPGDFKLTVKTRKKECFGSAGCNITYQVDAAWSKAYDPSISYDLIYVVRGGEDGPVMNTMTIEGDNFTHETDENISTRSNKTKLTAVVSSVEAH